MKLAPGSLERVREWAATIARRRSEALATLEDEGVTLESAFLEQTPEGDFLIYYTRAQDFAAASGATARSRHPIDAYHQGVKAETWTETSPLERPVDLERW